MYDLIILSLITGGVAFVAGEALRRKYKGSNEISRKLVHLLHGLVLACWAFIAPVWLIISAEVLFFACVLAVRYLNLLPWMRQVGRVSYGDLLYPIGVILAVLLADSPAVLAAAILQLALADSAAAIIGKKWGHTKQYISFGQAKSVAGSMAFLVVSAAITGLFMVSGLIEYSLALLIIAPLILTAVENVAGYGFDNAFIPVVAVVLLNLA